MKYRTPSRIEKYVYSEKEYRTLNRIVMYVYLIKYRTLGRIEIFIERKYGSLSREISAERKHRTWNKVEISTEGE